ncbi:MAG: alpha/beta hydrolase [Pseudomonadales bacterium]|nr:MAG: alpha/beta hydrolase [Pseudomonadales bacterium]
MKLLKHISLALLVLIIGAWLVTWLALRFEQHQYLQLNDAQLTDADRYIQGKLTPEPANWQWRTFEPEPGVELRTGMVDASDARGTIVIVPGFTATIEMVWREIDTFHKAGYRVASLEYRGQGESYRPIRNPEKGYVESYATLAKEVAEFAESVRLADKPLFFFSISKGAHITMRMAGEQNVNPDAYALIVPLIKLNTGDFAYDQMRKVVSVFHHLGLGTLYGPGQSMWPSGELQFGKAIDCNANPATAQTREAIFALRETSRTNGVTMSWLHRTAESTDLITSPFHMAKITQPVKMFTAGIDTLVDSDAAQAFCDNLEHCERTHYPQSRHCITREDFALYDGLLADTLKFFEAQR